MKVGVAVELGSGARDGNADGMFLCPLQEVRIMQPTTESKNSFSMRSFYKEPANGSRYPLVGGTRERHFVGTNSKLHKLLENAQTPTSRVHALLACVFMVRSIFFPEAAL